jgi:outer membrane protein OmpA-like peptidoglycan-associated protein
VRTRVPGAMIASPAALGAHDDTMTRLLLLAFAAFIAGCASTGPGPAAPSWPGQAPPAPAAPPPLAQEQRWLGQWFQGTPVVVAPGEDGAVEVGVPLEFSFDAGKSAVKPPLAAVLDKVSESLHRHAGARVLVSAPAIDGASAATLARERTGRMRDYLMNKGVLSRRIEPVTINGAKEVALRLMPGPPGSEKLEDAPPSAGRRITPPPQPSR